MLTDRNKSFYSREPSYKFKLGKIELQIRSGAGLRTEITS